MIILAMIDHGVNTLAPARMRGGQFLNIIRIPLFAAVADSFQRFGDLIENHRIIYC